MTTTTNSASTGGLSGFLANTRRVGGIAGIAYIVLFVAAVVLQGDTPMGDDDAGAIRDFFGDSDKSNMYLVTDWLIGVAFIVFFLPFLSALRSVLGPVDPGGGTWARLSFGGGIILLAAGLAASLPYGALALSDASGLDDETLLFARDMNAYGFGSGMPLAMVALITPASLIVLASGVFWKWLGYFGVVVALCNIVGALWVVGGEQESAIGVFGIVGFIGYGVWVLITSIAMLRAGSTTTAA